jgi:hypothetical protein
MQSIFYPITQVLTRFSFIVYYFFENKVEISQQWTSKSSRCTSVDNENSKA